MASSPLKSLTGYNQFVAEILDRPSVIRSTLSIWSDSPFTGVAEGEILFTDQIRLRIREELDFDEGLITAYGYEVYRQDERVYWYDDFPHPNDPELATTFPHHKHIPPNIKQNRVPAPGISFEQPNLPFLIEEIEKIST